MAPTAFDEPYSHLNVASQDLGSMRVMLARVLGCLESNSGPLVDGVSQVQDGREDDGRAHRIVLIRPKQLTQEPVLSAVGFFGEVRPGTQTVAAIHEADEELILEFPAFGGLLSYSSMQLPGENGRGEYRWGNLAIFLTDEMRDRWGRNERHMGVVKDLAAKHYRSIRIHHARLTLKPVELEIERTKYYSYENPLVWRAVRECPFRKAGVQGQGKEHENMAG